MTNCFWYLIIFVALVLVKYNTGLAVPTGLIVLWGIVTAGKVLFTAACSLYGLFSETSADGDDNNYTEQN